MSQSKKAEIDSIELAKIDESIQKLTDEINMTEKERIEIEVLIIYII